MHDTSSISILQAIVQLVGGAFCVAPYFIKWGFSSFASKEGRPKAVK